MDRPDIVLNSPVSGKPAVYNWPLTYVSKGQKIDGAEEIIETIRWVAREFIEFKPAIENILPNQPDPKSYEFIKDLCDRYNRILEMVTKLNKGTSVAPKTSPRASQGLLKHIIQQVYNYAVDEPTELNKYSPFSSETYGETNFEFMAQLIEKNQFRPKENDIFIDMGSGVGHLVLQMAASVDCKKCYGIEISDVPAGYAKKMEERFQFWMNWHGKTFTEFELIHGDFFAPKYSDIIKNAQYILVNNYAFKPEVDHKLKQRFLDLKDGVQILSSKPFCSPKARVTERHLTDIGSIMRVVEIHPEQKKDTVSWTPKPLPYYLHILDASPVEKYYERKKRRQGRSVERGKPGKRRKTGKGDDSDEDSDDHVVYGPTTRKAWSEWCNSTNASNRASTDSVKSSRNNSTDTEHYESAIENEDNTNAAAATASDAIATATKPTKEGQAHKREKKIQDTQGAAADRSSAPSQGTSAQTKANLSANQAAKSCLDKKRDYASKKGAPNSTQNEKSYSCLTKSTSVVSNGSSPSKVPPLVIKVTPPVEAKALADEASKSTAAVMKSEIKVNDENGKQLRQRKRSTTAPQSTDEKAQPPTKAAKGKQSAKTSQAAGAENPVPSTSVTRGSKRNQQAAAKSPAKTAPVSRRRATNSGKTTSLDLLHTKTVESVSSSAGYFPQPAPGCEDHNLRSIVETPSLPKVTIKDMSMYNDYVKKSEDRCLEAIKAELNTFLRKTLQPGYRETLTEQIRQQRIKKAMLMRDANELQREIKLLTDYIPIAMKSHADHLSIKRPADIVAKIGEQLRKHQELLSCTAQLEACLHSSQRTMHPPLAHSNNNQCLASPMSYNRGASSSATLDLSLK